jgi:hypothetical protein
LLFSGVANFGDWADVIHDLHPVWVWRTGLIFTGVVSYALLVWLSLLELRPFLGDRDYRRGGVRDLTILPYMIGGTLDTVAGMFNPIGMILVGLSAAAASFGGTSGMAWMTQCLGTKLVPKIISQPLTLARSWTWIIVACIAAAIFVSVLGRGVRFP